MEVGKTGSRPTRRDNWGTWALAAALGMGICAAHCGAQTGSRPARPAPAAAAVTGTLGGTVTDISGAVIPGAKVTVKLAAGTGSEKTTTDGAGEFQLAGLNPGAYAVTASAEGFAPAEATATVGSGPVTVNLALKVAQTTQTVQVSAANAVVQTSSTSVGGTLEAKQIQSVPLNGRSFTDVLAVSRAWLRRVRSRRMRL